MIRITDIRMPLLACTVALSGAAFAAGAEDFATADANDDSKLDAVEFKTTLADGTSDKKAAKSLKKADRNKHESIPLDEYLIFVGEKKPPTKQEQAFATANTTVDAVLTLEEYIAAFQGKGS